MIEEKPSCKECGLTFAREFTLRRHVERRHLLEDKECYGDDEKSSSEDEETSTEEESEEDETDYDEEDDSDEFNHIAHDKDGNVVELLGLK